MLRLKGTTRDSRPAHTGWLAMCNFVAQCAMAEWIWQQLLQIITRDAAHDVAQSRDSATVVQCSQACSASCACIVQRADNAV